MDENSWPSEWTRATLSICVLAVIEELRETYGYEIGARLRVLGLGQITGGTLYPVLKRLEQDAFLVSHWVDGQGGPGRKVYSLTPAGADNLRTVQAHWASFASIVKHAIEKGEVNNAE